LLEIVTLPPPETEIPYDDVPEMAKPEITMLLRADSAKALVPPVIDTPGLPANVIGLAVVPELAGFTDVPGYVPAVTCTVSPATIFLAAAPIVQNGCDAVPGPVSEQAGDVLFVT